MKYLLFQLYGLLQSWGTPLPGSWYRPCDDHPTKSGVVSGLLGACLGLQYGDSRLVDLQQLGFAVREDIPGSLKWDYHTIKVRDDADQIITEREYLVGALFSVALWGNTYTSLEKIAEALNSPTYVPYLGRKICMPSMPFMPKIIEAKTLKEAFASYIADTTKEIPQNMKPFNTRVFWEGPDTSIKPTSKRVRRDVLHDAVNKTYRTRTEYEGRLECTSVN